MNNSNSNNLLIVSDVDDNGQQIISTWELYQTDILNTPGPYITQIHLVWNLTIWCEVWKIYVLSKNSLSVKQTQIQRLSTTVNYTVLSAITMVFNHSILYFGWKKNTTLCSAESPWFSTGAGHQEQQRSQLRNTYLVSRTLGRHQTTREHGQKFTLFTWTWLESFSEISVSRQSMSHT